MLLIELENARLVETNPYRNEVVLEETFEHITVSVYSICCIVDRFPEGCVILLGGDQTREYFTKESYATILAKIRDAEDDYYFRNYVIRPWEDKKEDTPNE